MDLYRRYTQDLSADTSDIDYCVAFIKSFRTLNEDFVKGTIWHELWEKAPLLSDLELTKAVVELSLSLEHDTSLYGKYTNGSAYDTEVR